MQIDTIEQMEENKAQELAIQMGDKLRAISEEAVKKANKLAGLYGLEVEMQFVIKKKESLDSQQVTKSKKRKSKQS